VTRAQLCALADRYLSALLAREPSRLPVAAKLRCTENGRELPLGEGLWKTARALRARRLFADPQAGQVAIFAVVDDGGALAVVAVRLAVAGGELCEVETLVSHAGESSIFAPESLLVGTPAAARPIDPSARATREELIRVVDSYFEGIERNSSAGVPFAPGCNRIENGLQTTSNPAVLGGLGVAEQFDRKLFAYIERVRARRYPLADGETGQVLAIVFLDVPGTVTSIESGGRRIELPPHFRRPRSTLLFERFEVEAGRIFAIEAFMHNLPYGASSGWERSPVTSSD
jgi:hypothetical protein